MSENKDIIVAMTGTVTIATEEYRRLIAAETILHSVFMRARPEKAISYDVLEFVRETIATYDSVFAPVITARGEESDGGEGA